MISLELTAIEAAGMTTIECYVLLNRQSKSYTVVYVALVALLVRLNTIPSRIALLSIVFEST